MEAKLTREEMLERLMRSYEPYFDVERYEDGEKDDMPLSAHCRFYVHSSKYVLIKKAQLWAADCNEYVYVFSVPELTEEVFARCRDYAYEEGMKLVNPKPDHMYSYITAVFLCDTCTPEARKALQKCRIYKSFHFSLYGWMDFHTALLVRGENRSYTNRSGRGNAKLMKSILNS